MNESSNRLVRKFNPGTFQSDEEVIAQFVVRQRELGIVLDVLRGNIDSASCQHVLVVGPRGWGKTMLLARVAAELNADDKLSECLLPVRFMEESHEIFNLTDFWLETLFYLVRESASRDPELARELREVHAELVKRWGEETLADRVRATVLDAADRLGKRLVLMIENMQDLCANVEEDFGWQLRETLQSEPQVMLLATATSRFRGLDNVEQPFFELFRIISLAPLDTEECRHLWKVVSGDHVSGREIRPLEILTGGSPRLLVIIAGFAQHRSLHQLMEDLVQLIDDHTEYFRNHLEVFAKSERRVYLGVIDLWQPSSTGEIAMRARMDVRTVSTLLGRLVKRGAVTGKKIGKKRFYTATARLYSLYYKLRRERDEAAVVRHLIHFMSVFYSEAELAEMSVKLMAEAEKFPIIWEGIERAIEEVPDIGSMFPNMVRPNIDRVSRPAMAIDDENVERLLEEVTTVFDKAAKYEELGEFASAIATYDEAITRIGDSDTPELLDS
ncbi:MAG: AAA family ATPase, partial [Bacteroidetes bacterium SB0668_bin_1]|nr:AAA family ATPase [Bacteroidetes bacterium SB0668_bin_1]